MAKTHGFVIKKVKYSKNHGLLILFYKKCLSLQTKLYKIVQFL